MDQIIEIVAVLHQNRFIETKLRHQPGMPFLCHSPLTCHYQHRIPRQQPDESERNEGDTYKGGNDDTQFSEEKG